MSVYHSMRASQTTVGDDGDDEDLIVVNISATGNGRQQQHQVNMVIAQQPHQQQHQQQQLSADLHPAAERSPSHVSVHIFRVTNRSISM